MKHRGSALLIVLAILAVATGGAWLVKPSLFPGESRRASNSTKTTEQLIAATDRQGAVVAASLVKIGEANGEAPPSPQKSFIAQETTLALTLLPAANAMALIEAERRKVAVLEGNLNESRRLYESAATNAARLQRERDAAIASKRESDDALQQAAAAHHAQTLLFIGAGIIAILALAVAAYLKFYGVGPSALGNLMHDIKSGVALEHAFDAAIPKRLHGAVAKHRKLSQP